MIGFRIHFLLWYQLALIPIIGDLVLEYYGKKKEEIKKEHNQLHRSIQKLASTRHAKLHYEKEK